MVGVRHYLPDVTLAPDVSRVFAGPIDRSGSLNKSSYAGKRCRLRAAANHNIKLTF
jgi:hypothetical protein